MGPYRVLTMAKWWFGFIILQKYGYGQAVRNWQRWAHLDYTSVPACIPTDASRCFGNGECYSSDPDWTTNNPSNPNYCVCYIGWRGPLCSQLDLLPARKDKGHGLPMNGSMPTWGGSGIEENGTWYFFTGHKFYHTDNANGARFTESAFMRDPYFLPDPPFQHFDVSAETNYWGRSPVYNESAIFEPEGVPAPIGQAPFTTIDNSNSPPTYQENYMWSYSTSRYADRDECKGGSGSSAWNAQWCHATRETDYYGNSYLTRMKSIGTLDGINPETGKAHVEGSDPAGPYVLDGVVMKGFRADIKRQYLGKDATPEQQRNADLFFFTAGRVYDYDTNSLTGELGFVVKRSTSGSILGPWEEHLAYGYRDNNHKNESCDGGGGYNNHLPDCVEGVDYYYDGNNHIHWLVPLGERSQTDWDCDIKDPSIAIHPNGTSIIVYRGVRCDANLAHDHTENVGILIADCWNCTYIRQGKILFADAEDMYMWLTDRGTHLIMHTQNTDHGTRYGIDMGTDHKKKRGAYAFSPDGVNNYQLSNWELFPAEIYWEDLSAQNSVIGTLSGVNQNSLASNPVSGHQALLKQQRPSLLFGDWRNPSRPTHLVSGVDYLFDPCCNWYIYGTGWTLIQPVNNMCRAGEVIDGTLMSHLHPNDLVSVDPNALLTAGETVPFTNIYPHLASKYPLSDVNPFPVEIPNATCISCNSTARLENIGCGRCLEATSKYGSCVCAKCEYPYQGDNCDESGVDCQYSGSDFGTGGAPDYISLTDPDYGVAVSNAFGRKRKCNPELASSSATYTWGAAQVRASTSALLLAGNNGGTTADDEAIAGKCWAACKMNIEMFGYGTSGNTEISCCYAFINSGGTPSCVMHPGSSGITTTNAAKQTTTFCKPVTGLDLSCTTSTSTTTTSTAVTTSTTTTSTTSAAVSTTSSTTISITTSAATSTPPVPISSVTTAYIGSTKSNSATDGGTTDNSTTNSAVVDSSTTTRAWTSATAETAITTLASTIVGSDGATTTGSNGNAGGVDSGSATANTTESGITAGSNGQIQSIKIRTKVGFNVTVLLSETDSTRTPEAWILSIKNQVQQPLRDSVCSGIKVIVTNVANVTCNEMVNLKQLSYLNAAGSNIDIEINSTVLNTRLLRLLRQEDPATPEKDRQQDGNSMEMERRLFSESNIDGVQRRLTSESIYVIVEQESSFESSADAKLLMDSFKSTTTNAGGLTSLTQFTVKVSQETSTLLKQITPFLGGEIEATIDPSKLEAKTEITAQVIDNASPGNLKTVTTEKIGLWDDGVMYHLATSVDLLVGDKAIANPALLSSSANTNNDIGAKAGTSDIENDKTDTGTIVAVAAGLTVLFVCIGYRVRNHYYRTVKKKVRSSFIVGSSQMHEINDEPMKTEFSKIEDDASQPIQRKSGAEIDRDRPDASSEEELAVVGSQEEKRKEPPDVVRKSDVADDADDAAKTGATAAAAEFSPEETKPGTFALKYNAATEISDAVEGKTDAEPDVADIVVAKRVSHLGTKRESHIIGEMADVVLIPEVGDVDQPKAEELKPEEPAQTKSKSKELFAAELSVRVEPANAKSKSKESTESVGDEHQHANQSLRESVPLGGNVPGKSLGRLMSEEDFNDDHVDERGNAVIDVNGIDVVIDKRKTKDIKLFRSKTIDSNALEDSPSKREDNPAAGRSRLVRQSSVLKERSPGSRTSLPPKQPKRQTPPPRQQSTQDFSGGNAR